MMLNVNDAYSDFIQKLMEVINKVVPVKNKRKKRNSQEWLDNEVSENLKMRDKLSRNTENLGFIKINRFMKRHDIVCKISLQKRIKNFSKTKSKSI